MAAGSTPAGTQDNVRALAESRGLEIVQPKLARKRPAERVSRDAGAARVDLRLQPVSLTLSEEQQGAILSRVPIKGTRTPDGGTIILDEDFEGAWPAGDWASFDGELGAGAEAFWATSGFEFVSGSASIYSVGAGADGVPAPGPYPNGVISWALYGPFDLSGATTASMSFQLWLDSEQDADFLNWVFSTDCGGFSGFQTSGDSAGWYSPTPLDLTPAAGMPTVCVAFVFVTDGNTTADVGAFIDDVLITTDGAGSTTDLTFHGVDGVDGVFAPGDSIEFIYDVENLGTLSSPVDVTFYISTDSVITNGDTELDMMSLPSVPPGERHVFLAAPKTLTTIPGLADGDYYVGGILANDDNNANNTVVDPEPITIDSAATPPRDLELTAVLAEPGIYQHGETFEILFLAGNVGGRSSSSFRSPFYASADTTIMAGDHHLNPSDDTRFWFGLPPGVGFIYGVEADPIAVKVPDGLYYVGGILDPTTPELVSGNHTAYDDLRIKISNEPEMRIERNALEFDEANARGPEVGRSVGDARAAARQASIDRLPELIAKAEASSNRIPVIVGLNMAHQAEGRLSQAAAQRQQADIQNLGRQVVTALQGMNFREMRRFRHIPYMALEVDAAALNALAASPDVATIEEDLQARATLASSNPVIGSPGAWAEGYDGAGQVVAVLDTGVDSAHPWFTTEPPVGMGPGARVPDGPFSKIVEEACFSTTGGVYSSTCPGSADEETGPGTGVPCNLAVTGCDHGTHVAGIAAGYDGTGPDYGVAWGADIIAINVFRVTADAATCAPDPAPCISASAADVIAAIEHVYDLRKTYSIASINLSLGGGMYPDSATCGAAIPAYEAAMALARSADIAPVAASGNDGFQDMIGAPACVPSAVSVTATMDDDEIAGFSNVYADIDLAAPGVDITSAVAGTAMSASAGGTSQATPHVAGAWAIMRQADPVGVTETLQKFIDTATLVDDNRGMRLPDARGPVPVMDIPRINIDAAAILEPTTFGIYNDGGPALTVTDISPDAPAPWLSTTPPTPIEVPSGEVRFVKVLVDFGQAPEGTTVRRLTITSDDPDDSPWPDGVDVTVTTLPPPGLPFEHGFENPDL